MKSTWTCPSCERQNVYREGIVSDPQNKCWGCSTEVQIGVDRASPDPRVAEIQQRQDGRRAETEADAQFIKDIDCLLALLDSKTEFSYGPGVECHEPDNDCLKGRE